MTTQSFIFAVSKRLSQPTVMLGNLAIATYTSLVENLTCDL